MTRHFDHYASRTPAPGTVAAWLRLGIAPTERVPWWAAQWLADGHDGPALRELAGLNGREPYAVRDLLPTALAEAGVELPMTLTAAASEAFRLIAELHLTGQASARWVAQQIEHIASHTDYDHEVLTLPLGHLYDLADEWEWDDGWGRTEQKLQTEVRERCIEQTQAT
ncbi:hypothetical protein K7711_46735 [Nocardia sp. CA2R105]|uniref:hypothetical protein n=1 Tax=Nocardia coffeae TaxID=2873381 RepID=UPI001CA68B4D|nr:hypothetical protein [Nocardia coffeae]MBY8864030.1 hypothetical protein [Nocardia coffeae]